jgi:hypothetical protein
LMGFITTFIKEMSRKMRIILMSDVLYNLIPRGKTQEKVCCQ